MLFGKRRRGKYSWYQASRSITCRTSGLKVVAHGGTEGFSGKCFDRRLGLFARRNDRGVGFEEGGYNNRLSKPLYKTVWELTGALQTSTLVSVKLQSGASNVWLSDRWKRFTISPKRSFTETQHSGNTNSRPFWCPEPRKWGRVLNLTNHKLWCTWCTQDTLGLHLSSYFAP